MADNALTIKRQYTRRFKTSALINSAETDSNSDDGKKHEASTQSSRQSSPSPRSSPSREPTFDHHSPLPWDKQLSPHSLQDIKTSLSSPSASIPPSTSHTKKTEDAHKLEITPPNLHLHNNFQSLSGMASHTVDQSNLPPRPPPAPLPSLYQHSKKQFSDSPNSTYNNHNSDNNDDDVGYGDDADDNHFHHNRHVASRHSANGLHPLQHNGVLAAGGAGAPPPPAALAPAAAGAGGAAAASNAGNDYLADSGNEFEESDVDEGGDDDDKTLLNNSNNRLCQCRCHSRFHESSYYCFTNKETLQRVDLYRVGDNDSLFITCQSCVENPCTCPSKTLIISKKKGLQFSEYNQLQRNYVKQRILSLHITTSHPIIADGDIGVFYRKMLVDFNLYVQCTLAVEHFYNSDHSSPLTFASLGFDLQIQLLFNFVLRVGLMRTYPKERGININEFINFSLICLKKLLNLKEKIVLKHFLQNGPTTNLVDCQQIVSIFVFSMLRQIRTTVYFVQTWSTTLPVYLQTWQMP